MNKRIKKKHRGIVVDHMGYTAWQNWNNYHVMIVKNDRMVAHSQFGRRLKPRELKAEIELYIRWLNII